MDAETGFNLVLETLSIVLTWFGIAFIVIGLILVLLGQRDGDIQKTSKHSKTFFTGIALLASAGVIQPVGWGLYHFGTNLLHMVHT